MYNEFIGKEGIRKILKLIKNNSNNSSSGSSPEVNKWYIVSGEELISPSISTESTFKTYYDETQKILSFAINVKSEISCPITINFRKYSNSYSAYYYVTINDTLIQMNSVNKYTGSTNSSAIWSDTITLKAGVNNISISFSTSYKNEIWVTLPSLAEIA